MSLTLRGLAAIALTASVLSSCQARPRDTPVAAVRGTLRVGEGTVAVPGGNVWYRVVGTGTGTPLLLVHGGPGSRSCGMSALAALGDDRPVIFYDQLGTGRSIRPADTSFWNVAHFAGEIAAIRRQLGLRELHLLGHSWGGAVVTEYLLTHGDTGVRSLILSAPLLSTPRWLEDARILVSRLPEEQRRAIAAAEASGRYEDPAFLVANDTFSARHLSRTGAYLRYPECAGHTGNPAMYRAMWGPTEFTATGTLRDFDRSSRLGELRLPVLLIGGEHDEARPETLREFQQRIPGARLETIPNAAHVMMADQPELTVAALRRFLRDVERR